MIRKIRSDKKKEVKPTVSIYIRNNLFTLSRLVGLPVKDVALIMIHRAIHNDDVMRLFQPLMVSDFTIDNRIYVGNRENTPIHINYRGETGKVTIKFPSEIYEKLRLLAFSISLPPTTTAALILRKSMFNETFMDEHRNLYERYIQDAQQLRELNRFLDNLHKTMPKEVNVWNWQYK